MKKEKDICTKCSIDTDATQRRRGIIKIIASVALLAAALLIGYKPTRITLFIASYLVAGSEYIIYTIKNISKGRVFDENFLMTIATIGAFAIGEYAEAAAVMIFYNTGEFFQNLAVSRSRRSISNLIDVRPDTASLYVDGNVVSIESSQVKVGDSLLIRPGDRVPVDGKVESGSSFMDTSALTGESVPREVTVGDEVFSGSVNKTGTLTIRATKAYGESTLSRILALVENAAESKAGQENFITKFARIYTPVVVGAAALTAVIPPLAGWGSFYDWFYRALVFLVISCPCALVISIPLGFFGGIGGASKKGVLVKGGNYLEALNNIDIVVFDKTGTLTQGVFEVSEIRAEEGYSREQVLEYATHAEKFSTHPIAQSILRAYREETDGAQLQRHTEYPGLGVGITYKGMNILVGNERIMNKESIALKPLESAGTALYVAVDGKYAGCIIISDKVREDAGEAIAKLKSLGIRKTVMLTGDNESVAKRVSEELGIDVYHANLLPDQKLERINAYKTQSKGNLLYMGDGINDAPALAGADIGVAMGGLGSDAAIEAADVVLMSDRPSGLADGIAIARRTRNIVTQNIVFALGVKGVILFAALFGLPSIWAAIFADVGVSLLAVLNAARVLNTGRQAS
ncbi:MAG TPA: heavy metal translocating P-type ATPase [Clostridia bacterium]|nr:heavy metal translocating P-type ATPase [Clostridia bacterium]